MHFSCMFLKNISDIYKKKKKMLTILHLQTVSAIMNIKNKKHELLSVIMEIKVILSSIHSRIKYICNIY